MANYVGFARSNYFDVKDPQAFEQFCAKWDLELLGGGKGEGNTPLYGFICRGEYGIPGGFEDPLSGEWTEADFLAEWSTHLADGWVGVVREVGYEKMRYLVGVTLAVNSRNEQVYLNLNSIYESAKGLGPRITPCEW